MGVVQKPGHVVVCGVDDTALRTIEQLLAAGADVVVVVDAVAEAGAVAERLLEQWDGPLVHGRLREAPAEARLPEAAAVVSLAADDLAALAAALLVRRLRPEAGDRVPAVGALAQFAHQGVAEVVEHLRPQGPVGARVPARRAETPGGHAGAPPGRGR